MHLTEENIAYETGDFWVLKQSGVFTVMCNGVTCAASDSAYSDLSLAVARCNYLNKRAMLKQ